MTWNLTGLFLGAGASHEVGLPLVSELTTEMRRELAPEKLRSYNRRQQRLGVGYPDAVIEDLASVIVRSDMHYENVLGYLETQVRRPQFSAFLQNYHGLYSMAVDIVHRLLSAMHTGNPAYIRSRLPFLSGLSHFASNNAPLWIFSLNHDLIVECIAAEHNLPLNCGFPSARVTLPRRDGNGRKIGEIQAEVISVEDLERGDTKFFQPGTRGINLLKIHGALDVFAFRDGHDFLKILPTGPGAEGVLDALRAVNDEVFDPAFRKRVYTANEIAYLDEGGETQFLRKSLLAGAFKFDVHRPGVLSNKFLQQFQSQIGYVSKLVCIGYGFGDTHINEVMRRWLEMTTERQMEIVGPDLKQLPAFLGHVAPQVTITQAVATDYLDVAAKIVRTRREVLLKRFYGWSRGQPTRAADFLAFMSMRTSAKATEVAEKVKSFIAPDGSLDTGGLSPEEFGRRLTEEVNGSVEDGLEAFLDSRDPKA